MVFRRKPRNDAKPEAKPDAKNPPKAPPTEEAPRMAGGIRVTEANTIMRGGR